ncbi:MAG: T9SS type A sorting domain-containing protein [Ignavibacteriaceae bacterium]
MYVKKHCFFVLVFLLLFSISAFSQDVLTLVPYDGTDATEMMNQIIADTTANNGIPPNRVYQLQEGGLYICQQTFYVEQEDVLRLVGAGTTKPIIYLFPTGTGSNPQNPPGYFVRTRGGDLEMTNIALSGYFEPVDSNFYNMQGGMLRSDTEGSSFIIDNCIFSNTRGQVLRTNASPVKVQFTDCIMTNLGSLAGSNLGAGKGIDLRDGSCDTLILVNNTFTNYQDRVVRHYNFGNPTGGTGDLDNLLIDHNTFYSGMGFHGTLSLGNLGSSATITNNLFVDGFASGEDSTDVTRTAEWANNGEFYPNGLNRMSWIFGGPNDTTNWTASNNFYAISDQGQAFFDAHTAEPIVEGSQFSWNINSRLGSDSVNAFTKIPDPGFTTVHDLIINIMEFYVDPAGGNKTKETGNWVRETDDMDRRSIVWVRDTLDASYSTSSQAYTGSLGDFPAGDLNWFPTKKAEWENWVTDVDDDEFSPTSFSLYQNYPNPFNPSTKITFILEESGFTTLSIYNLLGQKVETLVEEELPLGTHQITLDASTLSSGVYFYKLQSGQHSSVKKMMLLK